MAHPHQPTIYVPDIIDPATYAQFERLAAEKGFSVDQLVSQAVDNYLLRDKRN